MIRPFTLYRADCRQQARNADYPHKETITSLQDLLRTAKTDHIFSEMKGSHRAEDNYLSTDGIILDLDNTFSDSPEEWKTIDDIAEALPDVMFYYVESRNHMKPKEKRNSKGVVTYEEPRPKYHLYFPLSERITDHEAIKRLMLEAAGLYCNMDLASAEPQHFFYGVADAQGGEVEGTITIDEYITSCGEDLQGIIAGNLEEYEQKVKAGLYKPNNETAKAITRLNTYIGRKTAAPEEPQEAYSMADPVAWIEDAERDRRLKWLEKWAEENNVALGTRYKINTKTHPNALAICVTCPWEHEHSMNGAENESVIIIDAGGQMHYLCRHSHGGGLSWKDYRRKIEEDAEAERQQDAQEEQKAAYLQKSAAAQLGEFIGGIKDSVNTPVISTGFANLDEILDGGLYEGLYILGAISSLGKTTLALQLADNLAKAGQDVLIFSLEMARSELIAKSISRLTYLQADSRADAKTTRGITAGTRYAGYSKTEKTVINKAIATYKTYAGHIFIHEGIGNIGAEQVKDEVRQHIAITGNKPVIIIDYLQILAPYDMRASDKQNTDKAVLELKRLSRDYKIPVLGISSFNRDSYKAGGGINQGKVSMTDYKESGALEYSADVLMGLEFTSAGTKEYNERAEKRKDPRQIRLVILKNRNGKAWETASFNYYPLFNYYEEESGGFVPDEEAAGLFKGMKAK